MIPYDGGNSHIRAFGTAVSSWKKNDRKDSHYRPYYQVKGILVDVRYLMENRLYQDEKEMGRLAAVIRQL